MQLTDYAITEDNRLVYSPDGLREWTVWGIGKNGLLHGAGSFLTRQDINRFEIDKVPYREIMNFL